MPWTNNIKISGQLSKATPALVEFGNQLHMVHLGDTSNDIWHLIYDGDSWSALRDNPIKGQKSKATPALAVYDGKLHMIHLGDTSNDIWHLTYDGDSWSVLRDNPIKGQKSKATPALATFGSQLHMVHLGDEENDIWHSWFNGTDWEQNVRIEGQKSKAAPALAALGGQLHMVHLGDDSDQIWHSVFDGADWLSNAPIYYQRSRLAPSLASFAGRLHMVHLGEDSNQIWYSQFEMGRWTVNVRVPDQFSKASPTIAPFRARLSMVYLDNTSNDMWYTDSEGTLSVIRIGFKFAVPPLTNIDNVLTQARVIFGRVGFSIEEAAPRETLSVAVDLQDIDVSDCILGESTMEQNELFTFRNNLGPRDIAIYIVDSVLDPANTLAGCASHPYAVPACVIEANAPAAVMAHEIGHVLGLRHVNDSNNIMWKMANWTNPPPDLTIGQALTVQKSRYSRE